LTEIISQLAAVADEFEEAEKRLVKAEQAQRS